MVFSAAANIPALPGRARLGLEVLHLDQESMIDKCQGGADKATRLPQRGINAVHLESQQAQAAGTEERTQRPEDTNNRDGRPARVRQEEVKGPFQNAGRNLSQSALYSV